MSSLLADLALTFHAMGADDSSWALVRAHDAVVRLRVGQLVRLPTDLMACSVCGASAATQCASVRIAGTPYRDAQPTLPLLAHGEAGSPTKCSRAGVPRSPLMAATVCNEPACFAMAHTHLSIFAYQLFPSPRDTLPTPAPRDLTMLVTFEALWSTIGRVKGGALEWLLAHPHTRWHPSPMSVLVYSDARVEHRRCAARDCGARLAADATRASASAAIDQGGGHAWWLTAPICRKSVACATSVQTDLRAIVIEQEKAL